MKFIDLFAGVGGFRRGMELAGHECVGFCEWYKYATASYTSMHLITEEQRKYLATLDLKKRQKEILKEEYRNGEWYSNDIRNVDARSLPEADCWCFGAPCQDFSVAGKRAGLDGDRSSLVREVFRILWEIEEESRPEWLIYENVKGMFSSNRGFDYLEILLAMDELGYDCEWQLFNSKDWGVPQNRERVYTVGHLRRYGSRKIFPITGTDGENSVPINKIATTRPNRHSSSDVVDCNGIIGTLVSRDYNEPKQVAVRIDDDILLTGNNYNQSKVVHGNGGISRTVIGCGHSGNEPKVAIPVLTPDRENKRQNGRRFKEDGEPMFTLTGQDRHGVGVSVYDMYNKSVRDDGLCGTLTSNGNTSTTHCGSFGIMLPVKEATKQGYSIAHEGDSINLDRTGSSTRRGRIGNQVANTLDTSCNQWIFVQVSDELTVYAIWYEKYQCYIAIRKLTPKECFRLQGWTDDYFEKAQFVNSDSQLYKQAGNGVTVNVVYEIGSRIPI
ncbi:DNA (cytosine-5-)-methyltransferase [Roseburia hominis]|uniref:DNA (cytosine-5-)-methyltransferase n=1 Tax=Roseburia hominis TaxID=301301 RepID=UPI001F260B7D|nr:DNA (cytosine-5-)-methyltransferase [Roseburia hominis]